MGLGARLERRLASLGKPHGSTRPASWLAAPRRSPPLASRLADLLSSRFLGKPLTIRLGGGELGVPLGSAFGPIPVSGTPRRDGDNTS